MANSTQALQFRVTYPSRQVQNTADLSNLPTGATKRQLDKSSHPGPSSPAEKSNYSLRCWKISAPTS